MANNLDVLADELIRDEGFKSKVYVDTMGIPTVGVGRNLRDVGLSDVEIRFLLRNDITKVVQQLGTRLPMWNNLDPVRQRVLANMAFNMGIEKLLTFHNTLGLVASSQYELAAQEMLNSEWARQVGPRATRLAAMMKNGV